MVYIFKKCNLWVREINKINLWAASSVHCIKEKWSCRVNPIDFANCWGLLARRVGNLEVATLSRAIAYLAHLRRAEFAGRASFRPLGRTRWPPAHLRLLLSRPTAQGLAVAKFIQNTITKKLQNFAQGGIFMVDSKIETQLFIIVHYLQNMHLVSS